MSNRKRGPVSPEAVEAGQRLRDVRKRLGMTNQELGAAIGVTGFTINVAERGHYWPSGELLYYLSSQHGVRAAYILQGTGPIFEEDHGTAPALPLPLEVLRQLPRIPNPTTSEEGAQMLAAWSEMIEQVAERAAEKAVEKYRRGAGDE